MPLLDEELSALLDETARSFAVPADGPAAVLARAQGDATRDGAVDGAVVDDVVADGCGASRGHGDGVEGDGGDGGGSANGEGGGSGGGRSAATLPPPRPLRAPSVWRSSRGLLVAAAVIVVLIATLAGVLWSQSGPRTPVAARLPSSTKGASPGAATAPVTTTTIPSQNGSSAQGSDRTFGQPTSTGTNGRVGHGATSSASPSPKASAPSASGGGAGSTGTSTAPSSPEFASSGVGQSARIEQVGSLNLTVPKGHVASTVTALTALATANGGFVATTQTQGGNAPGTTPSGTVTLQVPVGSFQSVLHQARGLGTVTSLSTKATDVTGQYVDLQSRISALQATQQQYLTIMTRATTIGDVLAVQSDLENVESQIEQLQGQLGLLTSETDYSTLTATVSQAGAPKHHHHAAAKLSGWSRAWHDSLHGFNDATQGLISVGGPLLFALLCVIAVIFGGRLGWRRLQRRSL